MFLMITTSATAIVELTDQDPSTSSPRVLSILSQVLEHLVTRNDRLLATGGRGKRRLSAFDGVRAPAITLEKYVERIYKYTECSPACFVVGFVYMDRLVHKHPDSVLVVSLNVHRLLLTSVMVASKILDDVHYDNAFYARVGGVSNAEVNRLELELLFLLDFGVTVSSRVFESYCQHLEKQLIKCNSIVESRPSLLITSNGADEEEKNNHAKFLN